MTFIFSLACAKYFFKKLIKTKPLKPRYYLIVQPRQSLRQQKIRTSRLIQPTPTTNTIIKYLFS